LLRATPLTTMASPDVVDDEHAGAARATAATRASRSMGAVRRRLTRFVSLGNGRPRSQSRHRGDRPGQHRKRDFVSLQGRATRAVRLRCTHQSSGPPSPLLSARRSVVRPAMPAKASLVRPALPAPPRVVADASRCDLRAAPDASVLPYVVACLQSAPQHPMAAQRSTLRQRQLLVRARRELSALTSLPLQSQRLQPPCGGRAKTSQHTRAQVVNRALT